MGSSDSFQDLLLSDEWNPKDILNVPTPGVLGRTDSQSSYPPYSATPSSNHHEPPEASTPCTGPRLQLEKRALLQPLAICQTEASWAEHPHGSHLAKLPWVPVERQPSTHCGPLPSLYYFLPACPSRPLSGLRVLCATHAIAGPSTGRTVAEHGASVLQITCTRGFEHPFVYTYVNLGTASGRLNLHKTSDRERLQTLVGDAHVWIDRTNLMPSPSLGSATTTSATLNPGIILCRVRVYGTTGPWKSQPGFDPQGSASSGLVSVMGRGEGDDRARWPPGMTINDYTTGSSAALAIQSIILKRLKGEVDVCDGWLVGPSICATAMGILKYYKTSRFAAPADQEGVEALPSETLEAQTSLGYFKVLAPLPKLSGTPIHYAFGLLHTMGSEPPVFPGYDDGYDVRKVVPISREDVLHEIGGAAGQTLAWLRMPGKRLRMERDQSSSEEEGASAVSRVGRKTETVVSHHAQESISARIQGPAFYDACMNAAEICV